MATVITFDLDDTLYLERDFVRSGFVAADGWVRDRFAVAGFFDRAWALFEAGRRGDIFDRALSALHIRTSPALVQHLVGIYRDPQELFVYDLSAPRPPGTSPIIVTGLDTGEGFGAAGPLPLERPVFKQ